MTSLPDTDHTSALPIPETKGDRSLLVRLWHSRELVLTLVKRDLKIRYKSSALGFLWSFGRPLLLLLVIWAVFATIARIPSSHPMLPYSLHLLTALLPWMFVTGVVSEALYAILANSNVIKKVWLPTEVFPASTVIGHLVHFILAMVVLSVFIGGYALFGSIGGEKLGVMVLPGWEIAFLPLLVALQTALLLGVALIVSSLNVYYRDVSSLAEIVLTAWFYLTPAIYPANHAREELQARGLEFVYYIFLCNPMTPITLAYRRILYGRLFRGAPEVSDTTLLLGLGVTVLVTAGTLGLGIWMFRRLSKRFADEL
ncbi:MAG: ABC transporter permease [Sumerlaeia bacterium]